MYQSIKIKKRKQTDRCYYASECFPNRITYVTKDNQYFFVNEHASCDILHKFYNGLTYKSMSFFFNKTGNSSASASSDRDKLYEKQELLKIAQRLNKKIISRGKYLNIDYEPYLINTNTYRRDLMQEKIAHAEILIKKWDKKQKTVRANKIIKPTAPLFVSEIKNSYNPEIQTSANNNLSFFNRQRPLIEIKNNNVNISINNMYCNLL
jgi:hypothetical protein